MLEWRVLQKISTTLSSPSSMEDFLHVAILPWLAFGHMIPLLELSVALARAGIRVSFLCTPKNIRRLPRVPAGLRSLVEFVELPFSPVEGLDPQAEASVDIPLEQYIHLAASYDLLKDSVREFLAAASPDCLLYEFVSYWAPEIGRECGVPCVYFSAFSAAGLTFFGPPESAEEGHPWWRPSPRSITVKPQWVPFPSSVAFRPLEAEDFYWPFFTRDAGRISLVERYGRALAGCDAIAVRSCNELEGEYLELLGRLHRKPVIPVGLLLPEKKDFSRGEGPAQRTFEWLDGRKPKSVVFVSFGSEYKLTEEEVHELAYGLEMSGLPFLWALRRPFWLTDRDDDEALPRGFVRRTEDRGLVTFGWTPQQDILAHPSVGGCLFHSGWGSISEMLVHGHVLVLLPTYFDQGLNARQLVEKGLAIEVEKDEDGSFNRDKIAQALKAAVLSEEGEKLRLKTREIGATIGCQPLNDQYMKGFVDYLLQAYKKSY